VLLLSFFWEGFLCIFLGMLFHSITDFIYMYHEDVLYQREFFFLRWFYRKLDKTSKTLCA
jgi:hypothetical protein